MSVLGGFDGQLRELFAILLRMLIEHVAAYTMRAVQDERLCPVHAAEARGLLDRRHEVCERALVHAGRGVAALGRAGAGDPQASLAAQRVAAFTVGPAEREH